MPMVGGRDQNGIDILSIQHTPVIGTRGHVASNLCRGRFKPALSDVADSDDSTVLVCHEPAHDIRAAAAHTDDP